MTLVIGVDLSLTCTGLALPAGTVAIKKPASQRTWPELLRLQWMRDRVMQHVTETSKDPTDRGRRNVLVVVEGLAYSRANPHAAARAGLFWLLLDDLDSYPYASTAVVSPTCRAKYASGKGNAGKDVVMREVARRFPDFEGGEDEADALVLRAMGMDHLGVPLAPMPAVHREALNAVVWPRMEGE